MILYDAAKRLYAADPEAFDVMMASLEKASARRPDDTPGSEYAHQWGRLQGTLDAIKTAAAIERAIGATARAVALHAPSPTAQYSHSDDDATEGLTPHTIPDSVDAGDRLAEEAARG